MKVTKRKVNTKRHTTGWLIGGKWRTIRESVALAREGRVNGVLVRDHGGKEYITSAPGAEKLYDLPVKIEK